MHFHFERVCNDFGCKLIETNGEKDHVHLLLETLPHTTPSRLVNSLKGVSSRFLRQELATELAGLVPRIGKVLLERWLMVSKLFYLFMWRCSS